MAQGKLNNNDRSMPPGSTQSKKSTLKEMARHKRCRKKNETPREEDPSVQLYTCCLCPMSLSESETASLMMGGYEPKWRSPKPEVWAPATRAHGNMQMCQCSWWRSRQSGVTDGRVSVATALRYDRWAMDLIISLEEESHLALSCDLRYSLQSCCVVQGAVEH